MTIEVGKVTLPEGAGPTRSTAQVHFILSTTQGPTVKKLLTLISLTVPTSIFGLALFVSPVHAADASVTDKVSIQPVGDPVIATPGTRITAPSGRTAVISDTGMITGIVVTRTSTRVADNPVFTAPEPRDVVVAPVAQKNVSVSVTVECPAGANCVKTVIVCGTTDSIDRVILAKFGRRGRTARNRWLDHPVLNNRMSAR